MKVLRNFGYFNLLAGLPISYFMFSGAFLLMVPVGLVMVGLAWFYRARPFLGPGGQAGLGVLPVLFALALTVGLYAWGNRPFRQTVLVPAGYRGLVVVGYGVPRGQPQAWDEDGRLIRLSPQGAAAVQFDPIEGGRRGADYDKFYEVTTGGERRQLPVLNPLLFHSPAKTVGVYYAGPESGPDLFVCVVARADSLHYFLDPSGSYLRPAYVQRVKTTAAALGVPNQFPDPRFPDIH